MTTLRDDYAPIDDCAFVRESVSSAEVLHVFGAVDLASVGQFEQVVHDAGRRPRPLVIDLSECSYIGASGFSVLVRAYGRLGRSLRVVVPKSGIPAKLFEVLAADTVFAVTPSLEAAIHFGRAGKRSL